MAARSEVKARCPSCGAKYRLPAGSEGRKARCAKCQTLFRVADSLIATPDTLPSAFEATSVHSSQSKAQRNGDLRHPPTEDDILRWLAEAESDADRERRCERDEDGLDAFDMPATTHNMSSGTAARLSSDDGVTSPRLRLRIAENEANLESAGIAIRRAM